MKRMAGSCRDSTYLTLKIEAGYRKSMNHKKGRAWPGLSIFPH
jgi:hypothetical protein